MASTTLLDAMAGALSEALASSVTILGTQSVGGGSINHALSLDTSAGPFFAKWNPSPLPRLFSTEAEGLDALRRSPTSLRIPKVLAHREREGGCPSFLITELVELGPRSSDFDERLGVGLAELHRQSADAFGFAHDNYCGATPQPNGWMPRWIDFYRERRLGHQLELACRASRLSSRERRDVETLLSVLDDRLAGPEAPPALIHGDLWSGNLMSAAEGPALIDPAAYYGHREAEIGMMTLFGGFSARVFEAYERAFPLAPGWQQRNPLYELYHVMNHLNLFGGGYKGQAMAIVRSYL